MGGNSSGSYIDNILGEYDIILPKMRNYYIETNYSQYVHAHHEIDLELTRQIIAEKHTQYIETYDKSMKMTKGHRFNMMIMKKNILMNIVNGFLIYFLNWKKGWIFLHILIMMQEFLDL